MYCGKCGSECKDGKCPVCDSLNESNSNINKKNIFIIIVKVIIAIFIGSVASFILGLFNEGLHALVTCGIFAFIIAGFVYFIFSGSGLEKFVAVAIFIVSFIIYIYIYSYVNEECESLLVFAIVAFTPYSILSYLILDS